MSYRNPQIIVDRSAEIYAQGVANLGQQMVGMVQNVVAKKKAEQAAIKKQKDAWSLVENDVAFNANKEADELYEKLEGNTLLGQFKNEYTNMLEGVDGGIGAIKAETILKTRGADLPSTERKKLNKIVSDARAYKTLMIDSGGVVLNDVQQFRERREAGTNDDFIWKGDTAREKFKSMVTMYALSEDKVTGVEQAKKLGKKNNVHTLSVDSKVDTNSELVKNFMKEGGYTLDQLFGSVDEKGFASIKYEVDIKKYGNGLFNQIPTGIDNSKTMETAGLIEKGKVAPGLIIQGTAIGMESSNGVKRSYENNYLDIDKIKNNKVLKDEYKAHAKGILTRPAHEQIEYMRYRLGIDGVNSLNWAKKTKDQKIKDIVDELETKAMVDLDLGGFVQRKATAEDVAFYKQNNMTLPSNGLVYVNSKKGAIKEIPKETDDGKLTNQQIKAKEKQKLNKITRDKVEKIDAYEDDLRIDGADAVQDIDRIISFAGSLDLGIVANRMLNSDGTKSLKIEVTGKNKDKYIILPSFDTKKIKEVLKKAAFGDPENYQESSDNKGDNKPVGSLDNLGE